MMIKSFKLDDIGITDAEYTTLLGIADIHSDQAWKTTEKSPLDADQYALVAKFKDAIKNYLFKIGQKGACCYCGITLSDHLGSFDAEHIISKRGKKFLVFAIQNLAVSCKVCNGSKGTKKVTIPSVNESDDFIFKPDDYIILNPHFHDWHDYLAYDKYGRVIDTHPLGKSTITICGINAMNALKLANHFDLFETLAEIDEWQSVYKVFADGIDLHKIKKYQSFMKKLLSIKSDPLNELSLVLSPLLNQHNIE